MLRLKALFDCLWFGLLPYWVYESKCHYEGTSYFEHMMINVRVARKWLTFSETESLRELARSPTTYFR